MEHGVGILAATLAVAGVCLAGPVSTAFARATWPARTPRAALVLWQAVCLGAGLSLVGSLVLVAVGSHGDNLAGSLAAVIGDAWGGVPFAGMRWWQVAGLVLAVVLAAHLLGILLRYLLHAVQRRRRHRALVDLLSTPARRHEQLGGRLADVRILDHPGPVAYSVPGWNHRVVLTAGLVDMLTPAELDVVLAHERAHLRARHDLLVLPFQAWAAALGVVPGVRRASAAVTELAEMLADDCAVRGCSPGVLAAALARVSLAGGPCPGADGGAPVRGAAGPVGPARSTESTAVAVTQRVRRLLAPSPLPLIATVGVYALAVLLIVVPTAVLLVGWN